MSPLLCFVTEYLLGLHGVCSLSIWERKPAGLHSVPGEQRYGWSCSPSCPIQPEERHLLPASVLLPSAASRSTHSFVSPLASKVAIGDYFRWFSGCKMT